MLTKDDVQSFIDRLDSGALEVTELSSGLWRVKSQTGAEVVINYAPPVVLLRMRVMEPPAEDGKRTGLFQKLLEFNASDLLHGSYGLEGQHVVLTDALELENLDFSEFEASFDSMTLALAQHLGALAPYRER
jgi:hypothetical protein